MKAVKKGYKLTEVGVIPEDWEATCLGNFLLLQRGHDLTWRERRRGDIPVMGSAGQNGFHDTFLVEGPGIVLGRSGASFGQAHYCKKDFWPHNTTLYVTDFFGNDKVFAFYLLTLLDFSQHNSGGAQQSLNRNFIAPIPVSIPSVQEQEAIAGALSDVDALILVLESLITKKRHIKQGAMQQLLRPKEGWAEKKLGDVASFNKGKGLSKSQLTPNGKFECIHYGELFTKYKERIYHIQHRTNLDADVVYSKANDILMPTSDVTPNGLATASCITKGGVILGGDILVIRPDNNVLDGVFFSYLVNVEREQIMQLVTGSTVYHLYGSDMAKFDLIMPPTIEEQTAIATILSDMDTEITALETKLAKTRQLKQGMMAELLTGRIRLV